MTNRTARHGFHQRQREAFIQALRNPTALQMQRRVRELADAGRSDDEIAAATGLDIASVRRVIGERPA